MKQHELFSKAKNRDLRGSLAGMQRAAELARRIAVQTDTAIVVVQDGVLVHSRRAIAQWSTDVNGIRFGARALAWWAKPMATAR